MDKIVAEWNQKKFLPNPLIAYQKLTGGTVSQVWLLTDSHQHQYVFKMNENIQAEIDYLTKHADNQFLPTVLFVDLKNKGYLYPFLLGQVEKKMKNKQKQLTTFTIELLNHYQTIETTRWGWVNEPKENWQAFLLSEIEEIKEVNGRVLTDLDYQLVKGICLEKKTPSEAYFLHGDSGVHNFLQSDGELVGVIDPEPLIGPKIHDLVSAFCSSPEELTYEVIAAAVSHLEDEKWTKRALIEEVLIGLYFRFTRCLYHHSEDLPQYLIAWDYWKEKYFNEIKKEAVAVFWSEFLKATNRPPHTPYLEAFYFDLTKDSANHLLELVLSGQKTATASSLLFYEKTGEKIPEPGDLSIVTDWEGKPHCVIETKKITKIPYHEMTYAICRREGEDATLDSWKEKHALFFKNEGKAIGYSFTEEMMVLFEDFQVVYQIEKQGELPC